MPVECQQRAEVARVVTLHCPAQQPHFVKRQSTVPSSFACQCAHEDSRPHSPCRRSLATRSCASSVRVVDRQQQLLRAARDAAVL
jgi:hypothetical protein